MSADDHRGWETQLGAYVLGQLPREQAERVREHLAECARCRAEHADLAPLASALREVDPDEIGRDAHPPRDLGERIARRIETERRRQSRAEVARWSLVGAVSAAAAGLAVVLGLTLLTDSSPVPEAPREPIEVVALEPGVDADGALIAHTWGTELILTATGLEDGATYRVAYETAGGAIVPSGTFIGDSSRPVVCRLNAAVLREDADALRITKENEVVLRSEL